MSRRVSVVIALLISSTAVADVQLEPFATGLDRPVQVVTAHDGSQALFVALQTGIVLRFAEQGAAPTTFLDLSSRVSCCSNGGLLSLVFDPHYTTNGRMYVLYVDLNGDTVLARVQAGSIEVLLVADQPIDNIPNHHGGTLQFGPDGMLYVSIGDGGAFVTVTNRAQQLTHVLVKLLRLEVDIEPKDMRFLPTILSQACPARAGRSGRSGLEIPGDTVLIGAPASYSWLTSARTHGKKLMS